MPSTRGGFVPPFLAPLNCSGTSTEEIGRLMGNLAATGFFFRGVWFASVEAFYIGLKTLDEELRLQLAKLSGMEAKHMGMKLSRKGKGITRTCFDGVWFDLGSPEHHALVKEVIRAKLVQNPEILRAFIATSPRPIIHDTGFPESRFTKLPGEVFCRILRELRDELA
jgi:hypothetical protein